MTRAAAIVLLVPTVLVAAAWGGETPPSHKEVEQLASDELNAVVFMLPDASDAQIDAVSARLERASRVDAYAFVSKEDAWEELQRQFADQPDLIQGAVPTELPASFELALRARTDRDRLARSLEAIPGVDIVSLEFRAPGDDKEVSHRELPTLEADAEVYMEVDATVQDVKTIRGLLRESEDVYAFGEVTKEAAADDYRRLIPKNERPSEDLLATDDFAVSFRVLFVEGARTDLFKLVLEQRPEVALVTLSPGLGSGPALALA